VNEKLIKELIRLKLRAADAVLDQLPPELSEEIRSLGRIVVEALNEGVEGMEAAKGKEIKASGGINTIPVE